MKSKQDTNIYQSTAQRAVMACAIIVGVLTVTTNAQQMTASKPRAFKVVVTGHGKPMILIPGLASAGEVWDSTVDHYKSQYECHVLTLAGFAGEPPIDGPLLETVRVQLAAYIREKKLNKPVIVGHSLGGFLALWLAAKEPDLTGPLVIVDMAPFLPALQTPGATVESARAQAETIRKAIAGQTREQYEKFAAGMLGTMITSEDKIALATKWGLASDFKTIGQGMYELFTIDLRQDIAAIKSPTLVIGTWIAYKAYTTREQVDAGFRAQYAKLAGYQFILTDKAKHFVMYDDPEGFFAALDKFLIAPKATH